VDEQRRWFAVDRDLTNRNDAEAVCAAVVEVLRPVLRRVRVDAVSDYADEMPPSVAEAEAVLRALARRQRPHDRDPVTAVEVTPADAEWAAMERYAAWSIDVDLLGEDEQGVGSLHDCGWSVTAALTDNEVALLRERVGAKAPVTLLAAVHERRRQQKREQRKARLGSVWPFRRQR